MRDVTTRGSRTWGVHPGTRRRMIVAVRRRPTRGSGHCPDWTSGTAGGHRDSSGRERLRLGSPDLEGDRWSEDVLLEEKERTEHLHACHNEQKNICAS
ncbi:hypothetical protein AVEN_135430-1 [Araneus ventricosus]|uniref:Uncharacterized protein n=1 Tax=Araneus ventricosus TaxID=182803 RepID=A0A4Y2BCX9_ARAVE|nr:hypothetical protein AVEN_135430-1 [Araneus ventricosus]